MLRRLSPSPRRILMTLDAVGGVWRYATDLARGLAGKGRATLFVGQGPLPSDEQRREIEAIPGSRLVWLDPPLDWMAASPDDLAPLPRLLSNLASAWNVDLMHLNLPSQAVGLQVGCPVVVVSHSCLSTWWAAVKGGDVPQDWAWQHGLTRRGFEAADVVLAPSQSHAEALVAAYGPVANLHVVPNGIAATPPAASRPRKPFVFAAGRWWDEGKNARVLDEAAAAVEWPVLMAGPCRGPMGQGIDFAAARALGAMAHGDVRELMAQAALFVSPSVYEPFGLAALEAAAEAAPLLLADIPTYRELWDGAAAFFAPDDAPGLAALIERLADDPTERERLGARARERATRYTLAAQLAAFMPICDGIAARRAPVSQSLTG
jgi:glycosyltransferase involved in cell wall biosynthesis